MAHCAYCHAETEMYFNEVPLGVACSERQDAAKRPQALESQLRARMM